MNEEHLVDIPPTDAEIANDLLTAQADNLESDAILARSEARRELEARLEDARGESSWCNDKDCSCHRVMYEIELELEELDS